MIHSKKFHMRFRMSGIGPGGWNCNCCGPAPGKQRTIHCRIKKRSNERNWFKRFVVDSLFNDK